MERIRPYTKHAYKHNPGLCVIVDYDNYELCHIQDNPSEAIRTAVQVLIKDRFVKIIQGPGPWLTLNLDEGVDPKGEWRSDRIPPPYWETLDDETREKLK